MCSSSQHVPMGFTQTPFPAGSHMCLLYDDDAERRRLISRFLDAGLTAGEKVGYFADDQTAEEVMSWLQAEGVRVRRREPGRLAISGAVATYCPQGRFVPDAMLEKLRSFYRQAVVEEHHSGARVSGEMSWALRGVPGSERLMEYEALVNNVLASHPVTAICQYDVNAFDGATILNVLKVHPMMIVRGQIVENPYYMKPDEFLRE